MTSAEDVAPLTTYQMNLIYDEVVKAGYQGLADHWIARAKAAEAESARLRDALKPFGGHDVPANYSDHMTINMVVRVSDLRRAARLQAACVHQLRRMM